MHSISQTVYSKLLHKMQQAHTTRLIKERSEVDGKNILGVESIPSLLRMALGFP